MASHSLYVWLWHTALVALAAFHQETKDKDLLPFMALLWLMMTHEPVKWQ
jgi:hypothetical protein